MWNGTLVASEATARNTGSTPVLSSNAPVAQMDERLATNQ